MINRTCFEIEHTKRVPEGVERGGSMKGLEGIKVVELTGYVAAPACPRILGEMERPSTNRTVLGDEYRTNGPGFACRSTDIDASCVRPGIHETRNFLSVNLKGPGGCGVCREALSGRRCHDEFSRQCPKEARSRLRSGACAIPPRLGADARPWGIRS